MGKAAAKTVVFHGVGNEHFHEHYLPVYKNIVNDNLYGRFLFSVTELSVVKKEQAEPNSSKVLSSILWDMFTGNERYKNVFKRTLDVRMNIEQVKSMVRNFSGGQYG
ncbi:MAG: hypothetical protein ACYSW7_12515 [Planctomycetota bacterium]|jgi:hypothetical protein